MRRAYSDFVCLILRNDGLFYQFHLDDEHIEKLPMTKNNKTFTYRNNTYVFNPDYAHHLKGWVPWKEFEVFAPWSLPLEIWWKATHKVGIVLYREPKPTVPKISPEIKPIRELPEEKVGVQPEQVKPVAPVVTREITQTILLEKSSLVLEKPSSTLEQSSKLITPISMHIETGYTRYSPLSFKAIVLSPLYNLYRKKLRFGKSGMKQGWVFWLMLGVIAILAALLLLWRH